MMNLYILQAESTKVNTQTLVFKAPSLKLFRLKFDYNKIKDCVHLECIGIQIKIQTINL